MSSPSPSLQKKTSSSPKLLLPLPARFFAPSDPAAGSGRVRLPSELGIALASAVRVRLELTEDSAEQPKRQLSLLCWADVIPKQPEGGPFEGGDKQGAVFVDLKTLSAPLAASSPLSVEPLLPFLSLQGAFPPPLRVVDVRLLGKAGRVASATRVVVRQERLLLPPSPSSAAKGESGERGDSAGARSSSSPSISREALSVVLAGALVEVGAAVLPVGAAAASLFSLPLPVPLCLLRVVAAEPEEGSGAPLRVVRSTRVELL